MKLGRNPHDPALYARLPHAGPHLDAVAAQAPDAIDWSRDVAPGTWGMCVNDTIGDCLIGETLTVAPGMVKAYRAQYCGPVVRIETRTGKRLTATRNHLVLTHRGFVPAHSIQKTDYLLSSRFPQAIASGMDNDLKNAPSRIEDIFQAHQGVGLTRRKERQMRTAIDFHGDARFFKSEIDVVDADGLLQNGHVSMARQPKGESGLILIRGASHSLNGKRSAKSRSQSVRASSTRSVGVGSKSNLLIRRPLVGSQLTGLGKRAHLHASPTQRGVQEFPTDPQLPGELLNRFPGQIALDRVINVEAGSGAGHIYDLSCVPNWYIGNGLIIHNCTCAAVAHAIALWESHCPPLTFLPDSDVVALYSVVSGYKPGDPATDTGARCSDVLSQWLADGVPCAGELDRLSAFATLDPKNHAYITAAIWTFGCLYAGVVLHESDIDNFEQSRAWADATGAVEGGHCILLCAADSDGPTCITWGQTQKMTWAWWDACTEECYALLSPRWLAAGKTPSGFPLDALLAEMAALKQ